MVKTNINIADTELNSKLVKNFLKSEELNGFYSFKNDIKNYEDLIKKRSFIDCNFVFQRPIFLKH